MPVDLEFFFDTSLLLLYGLICIWYNNVTTIVVGKGVCLLGKRITHVNKLQSR
jgi:hypothetical protein